MVVDDEPMIHDVFRMAFAGTHAVEGFRSGEEAIQAARAAPFSVAILDLNMEGLGGIETLVELKKILPHLQVIIFTGYASLPTAIDAVNFGAFRYLQKPFRLVELKEAVAAAFARHEVERHGPALPNAEALAAIGLTGRKGTVARFILQHKSTPEIAAALQISTRTAEKHLENLYHALGVSRRLDAFAKLRTLLHSLPIAAPLTAAFLQTLSLS